MGEKEKKCASTALLLYFKFNSHSCCLCCCICLLAHTGPSWYFWYFWSVLPQIGKFWFISLCSESPLRTCLEERNQARGRHAKKWQQSDTGFFSGAPGPLLVLKNRKCLSPCPEVWAGLDPWISSPTNHPLGSENRRGSSVDFPFEKHFLRGRGKEQNFGLNYLLWMLLEALYFSPDLLLYIYY